MPTPESKEFVFLLIDRLKVERRSRKVTLAKLSEVSGVDIGAISRAENHKRVPGMAALRDITLGLGLSWPKLVSSIEKELTV